MINQEWTISLDFHFVTTYQNWISIYNIDVNETFDD